jgi:hypothetical protein
VGRGLIDPFTHKAYGSLNGDIFLGGSTGDLLFPVYQAGDGSEQGGFSGAIGTYQADEFTFINPHTQIIDQHGFVVTNRQIGNFEQQI